MVESIAICGSFPEDTHEKCLQITGVYDMRDEEVNGRPTFVKRFNENMFMWSTGDESWFVGPSHLIGEKKGRAYCADAATHPALIRSPWKIYKQAPPNAPSAPDIKIFVQPPRDEEVACVGVRTREQRDADGRKHAIDLNLLDAKRPRTASSELQTRVTKARSVCSPAIDAKMREHMKPAYDAFMREEIDGASLEQRRAAARSKAEADHPPLAKLNTAFATYSAAVAARANAEDGLEAALAAEDAAESALQAAVQGMLPGEGGPSGVTKGEN